MDDLDAKPRSGAMTTGKAVGIYVACLAALLVLGKALPFTFACIGYLLLGFILNRVVLRGLIEWHPVYNTLENVSSAKLGMLGLWPVRYPMLFFRILVDKHL